MKTKDVSIFNVLLTFTHSMHYKISLYFATGFTSLTNQTMIFTHHYLYFPADIEH